VGADVLDRRDGDVGGHGHLGPGLAARGNLTFLQISFGYLAGRIGVARCLLPGYFGDARYSLPGPRAALRTGRAAYGLRGLPPDPRVADCVRDLRHRHPTRHHHALEPRAGSWRSGMVTLVYTWVGGLRAVVWWTRSSSACTAGASRRSSSPRIWRAASGLRTRWDAGKLTALDSDIVTVLYTFGRSHRRRAPGRRSHGTILIVQRLSRPGPADAQRALMDRVCSFIGIRLFLLVGRPWLAGANHAACERRDLSDVRDHAAAHRARGLVWRDPRRGDEQHAFGRQLARLRLDSRLLRALTVARTRRVSCGWAAG